MAKMAITQGDQIPEFTLENHLGETVRIQPQDKESKYRLIYFYPKNGTAKCTEQACSLSLNLEAFEAFDCRIYGISSDSIQSHEKFIAKHQLNLNLLSDGQGKVRKLFGAYSFFNLIPARVSYLVDSNGKVKYSCSSMFSLENHINYILTLLKQEHE